MASNVGVDGTAWVAALEQLPPDSRGFRRTLRLHAVGVHSSGPTPRAACGYAFESEELRPNRSWGSVTPSGRCALCELQLRRGAAGAAVDLVEPGEVDLVEVEAVNLVERADADEPSSAHHRRLSVVPDESGDGASAERRSPGRP